MNRETKRKAIYKLAARMLREYCERLDNDGCNDYEIPNTGANRAIMREIEARPRFTVGGISISTFNNLIAEYLADKLERMRA